MASTRKTVNRLQKSLEALSAEDMDRSIIIVENTGWRHIQGNLVPGVIAHEEGEFIDNETFQDLIKDGDIPEDLANDPQYFERVIAII